MKSNDIPTVRTPPKESKIKNGADLDWATAERAAKAILKQCEDAHFAPPEAGDIHVMRVGYVCQAIDTLVDALRIRRGS